MTDRVAHVRAMIEAFNERRFGDFGDGFVPAGVLAFPQSGEVVTGGHKIGEMYDASPAPPVLTIRSLRETGGIVIAELAGDYGDAGDWSAMLIFEFDGDLVSRQTAHFGAPFDRPAWREPFLD